MTVPFYFDPFNKYYRSSHGAIEEGTLIRLRVKLLRTQLVSVRIVLIYDNTGEQTVQPLEWQSLDNGYDIYETLLNTANYKGLIWYYFEAVNLKGDRVFFGENTAKDTVSTEMPTAFQLTVFDKSILTPAWYSQGVTYHIFVDRFFRSEKSGKLIDDPDFIVHKCTDEKPEYLPDEKGEILNNDIYGGNLKGIEDKLDYLESLGVVTIYLSPVFQAWSNHKYNTADYLKIDSHFGDESDLKSLCSSAKKRGMHVILDGVFNHTGSDSVYFNQNNRYPSIGAYQSIDSPYRSWYNFDNSPIGYATWWGIRTLPSVNEMEQTYRNFIMGDDSVVSHWMKLGISGWRLDVADELPDDFLQEFHNKVRQCRDDAIVIGEVWEDASNKIAYDVRRKYFIAPELDGVMNYPIKEGILDFLNNRLSAYQFKHSLDILLDHYPKPVHCCLMNLIGTHDTMRAINALACPELAFQSKDFKAAYCMDSNLREYGKKRLMMASCLQYMFPGSPSLYYGDETGMEGFEDPFNRCCYPWENQDEDLILHYKKLGMLKKTCSALHDGDFTIECVNEHCVVFTRENISGIALCAVNKGNDTCYYSLPRTGEWVDIFTGDMCSVNEEEVIEISPDSYAVWVKV